MAGRFPLRAGARTLLLTAPRGLFSASGVDPGTRLLLAHLPSGIPSRVLDLGCGWGPIGLTVAALHPAARLVLLDRDLLAVEAARRNARDNQLDQRISVYASLGLRQLPATEEPFDWALCNVPARIGIPGIGALVEEMRLHLAAAGEVRLVAISPLAPHIALLAQERGWPLQAIAASARHAVFAVRAGGDGPSPRSTSVSIASDLPDGSRNQVIARPAPSIAGAGDLTGEVDVYRRDSVLLADRTGTFTLERPMDLGTSPAWLRLLVLLARCLPRGQAKTALCFGCRWGALPTLVARLSCCERVVATDRDLLGCAFIAHNAARLGLPIEVQPALEVGALEGEEKFPLLAGELSAALGEDWMAREVAACRRRLSPGGEAFLLVPSGSWRRLGAGHPLAEQEGWCVTRMVPGSG